jgi:ABC-2 type transport system ATP-binding protein
VEAKAQARAISVSGLTKYYGRKVALVDVGFEVDAGETVAILGPNGAGKTTTVEILEGFRHRSGGKVSVLGEDPGEAGRSWRARIGLVLQATSLDEQLTVGEELRLYAGMYPNPRSVDEVMHLVGLADEADLRIGALSGGQKRRVDLGLGIIGNPELLFLDEPTTGFDPAARRAAWETVGRLCAGGMTVVLTTHYLEEAERLADRVVVVAGGRVVADASPGEVGGLSGRGSLVRFPVPEGASLPAVLAGDATLEDGWATLRTDDLTPALGELLDWAREQEVDLNRLTVGRPTLEDAYLALTSGINEDGGLHEDA